MGEWGNTTREGGRVASRRQSSRFSTSASRSGGSGGQTNSRADLLLRVEVREKQMSEAEDKINRKHE